MKRLPLVFLSLFMVATCLWLAGSKPGVGKAAPNAAIPWWFGDDWDDFYHEYACVDGMNLWVMATGEEANVGDTYTLKGTTINSGVVVVDETLSFQYHDTDFNRPYAVHRIMWSESLQPGTVIQFESESEAFSNGLGFIREWKAHIRDCLVPTPQVPSQYRVVFARDHDDNYNWWPLELPIPSGGCVVDTRTIGVARNFIISDADVSIEVISDEPASISATLTSPTGTAITFIDENHTPDDMFGSPTQEYDDGEGNIYVAGAQREMKWPGRANDLIFDEDSIYELIDMTAPFVEMVVKPWPDQLSDLNGEESAGEWSLEICNSLTTGNATLQKWAIILEKDSTSLTITDVAATVLSPNSALIEWQTDEPADSRVFYGTTSGVLPLEESDSALVTDHAVTLTGLTPDTTYYFMVSSADGTGNTAQSAEESFHTEPGEVQYTLTVAANGQGTVLKDPDKLYYESGEVVTLTAAPYTGYQFTGWSDDASGTANPIQITMTGDKSVTASFTPVIPDTYTLNTPSSVGGTIGRDPDKPAYQSGEVVTLTAMPAELL